jgi:hypothetical protein
MYTHDTFSHNFTCLAPVVTITDIKLKDKLYFACLPCFTFYKKVTLMKVAYLLKIQLPRKILQSRREETTLKCMAYRNDPFKN